MSSSIDKRKNGLSYWINNQQRRKVNIGIRLTNKLVRKEMTRRYEIRKELNLSCDVALVSKKYGSIHRY